MIYNRREISELLEFLESWLDYSKNSINGYDPKGIYSPYEGLCRAVFNYSNDTKKGQNILRSMKKLWLSQGLNQLFPFGKAAFYKSYDMGCMEKNRIRIKWVRETIKQLK